MRVCLWMIVSLLATGPALAADSYATEWSVGSKSKARLVAGDAANAAFEISLADGAITYWRNPGDAGVPPTFDYSASDNLAHAEIVFPAPKRIQESDGTDAFGYAGSVLFPIRVTAIDPARPVKLSVAANFAVCEKICLPAKANLTLTLPGGATPFAAAIAEARAAAPKQTSAEALGAEVARLGADLWRICFSGHDPARDLFVEAPAGYWLTVRATAAMTGKDCFEAHLDDAPAPAKAPLEITATVTGARPVETTLALP